MSDTEWSSAATTSVVVAPATMSAVIKVAAEPRMPKFIAGVPFGRTSPTTAEVGTFLCTGL